MTITDEVAREMRPHAVRFIHAVTARDMPAIDRVYREVSAVYGVADPGHAMAVLVADLLQSEQSRWRGMVARAQDETLQFQEAYLDQKRRVQELRARDDAAAAAAPERKDAA